MEMNWKHHQWDSWEIKTKYLVWPQAHILKRKHLHKWHLPLIKRGVIHVKVELPKALINGASEEGTRRPPPVRRQRTCAPWGPSTNIDAPQRLQALIKLADHSRLHNTNSKKYVPFMERIQCSKHKQVIAV